MNSGSVSLLLASLLPLQQLVGPVEARAAESREPSAISVGESEQILAGLYEALRDQAPLYFSPRTHAWYSQRLDKLPSVKDVADLYPNPVGYGTGMDDCPLFEGALLVALVELYDLTHAESLRRETFEAYQGLKLCGTAHGVRGFVARGVSIENGKSVYVTSSRDQYTHYVDGLWQYYHSPLCNEKTKGEIRELLTVLADAMAEQIVEENDFGFLRADGSKDPRGLHKMWRVYAHEAARLPMIYAAAWDVAGRKSDYQRYREYVIPAIAQSMELKDKPARELNARVPPYSYFQMQCSLGLLYRLEKDPNVKARILEAMKVAKRLAADKTPWAAKRHPRDLAEILIAQLMIKEFGLADDLKKFLREALALANLKKGGPPTTIHLLALYSKACQSGIFPVPQQPVSLKSWAPSTNDTAVADGEPARLFPLLNKPSKPARDEQLVVFLADPHVGISRADDETSKANLNGFKTFCDRILAMRPRPAVVIIPGDLALARGCKQDYEALKPVLARFDDAGIPWKVCLGETDRREPFFEVFQSIKARSSEVPGRLVEAVELPAADFILLDTLQEGLPGGAIDRAQREWLKAQIEKRQKSGKRFFVVSHHPVEELDVESLMKGASCCVGWISGHLHLWRQDAKSQPRRFSLQSTAYSPDATTRRGVTYLRMDRWEFVFRPISPDQDDVWERKIWVVRFPR